MGITATMKDGKLTVESDESCGDAKHGLIHEANELKGAMKAFDIEKVESQVDDTCLYELKEDFDKKYKEKTGDKIGYFHPR